MLGFRCCVMGILRLVERGLEFQCVVVRFFEFRCADWEVSLFRF